LDFQGLLEAAPDAMLGTDQAGVIRFVNRQTELLFDYDRTDLVGQPMEMLVPELSRKGHPAHHAHPYQWSEGPRYCTENDPTQLNLRPGVFGALCNLMHCGCVKIRCSWKVVEVQHG
jgi:PAS domain-containing protein